MQTAHSGGRRLTAAAIAGRHLHVEEGRSVSRRDLSAAGREACLALDLRTTLRVVLDVLVGCWGEQTWERMLVWPSNELLVERTGLSERGVRIALRDLIQAGLLTPKDSANGKRFAIRDRSGAIVDAFGFDLTPLVARRGEFEAILVQRKIEREHRRRTLDAITVARRASQSALEEIRLHFPTVDTRQHEQSLQQLLGRTPSRQVAHGSLSGLLSEWKQLQEQLEQLFNESGCGGTSSRHIETNNGSDRIFCNNSTNVKGAGVTASLVRQACPALGQYLNQPIRDETDLVDAVSQIRGMIGAHPSAWAEAEKSIGPVNAAAVMAMVLQLHCDDEASGLSRIQNPGGYFRTLVRLVRDGRYNLAAELETLRKRRLS